MSPFVQLACELESPRGLSFIAAAAHRSQPPSALHAPPLAPMAATTSRMPEQYQPLQEEEVDDVPFTPLKALQNVGVQQADI